MPARDPAYAPYGSASARAAVITIVSMPTGVLRQTSSYSGAVSWD